MAMEPFSQWKKRRCWLIIYHTWLIWLGVPEIKGPVHGEGFCCISGERYKDPGVPQQLLVLRVHV